MSDSINQQILLKSYPTGEPKESDFALVETAIPELGESEILTRTIYSNSHFEKKSEKILLFK
ncbi:hypothetical protein [Nostoc sp. FACHB-888]|uniref:hypothetical protein n=1 Tax=Nostoc sp. FACHB-888 TaxID=2692842 RepID=UPI001F552BF1|nr:hypothetical protein [Nostoc sp. FACHB-888]